jgi:hypothetical protein
MGEHQWNLRPFGMRSGHFSFLPPINSPFEGYGKLITINNVRAINFGYQCVYRGLKNDKMNDDFATPREKCYLPKPVS